MTDSQIHLRGAPGGQRPGRSAAVPRQVTCPICATSFDPYDLAGRCPVCGEAVVSEEAVSRVTPVLTPTMRWLRAGGWRLVLLALLIGYQIFLLIRVLQLFTAGHVL